MLEAEEIAQQFHETYERLAPAFGYETREASAVPWEQVPARNKRLMIEVVANLLDQGVIVSAADHDAAKQFVVEVRSWYNEALESGLVGKIEGMKK